MPFYVDGMNRTVEVPLSPKRIVSLVPSQTELLYHLGLSGEVAGITKFCIHPRAWFETKPRVGGTKTVNGAMVRGLQPDLVLGAKEENVKEQLDELSVHFPVWISDVHCFKDAIHAICSIGAMTGTGERAEDLAARLRTSFGSLANSLHAYKPVAPPLRAAYLIWNEPLMAAGGDTFISDMLGYAGFHNVFSGLRRYPIVTPEELAESGCNVVLLSSEPYPFREKHVAQFKKVLPRVHTALVNGELFSWYGSRLLQSPPYFEQVYNAVLRNV